MKSVGSRGRLSLLFVMRMMVRSSPLFMMKMMVQQFVIDSHKVVYDCTHVTLKIVVEITLQSHCYDVVVLHKSKPSTRTERMEGEHQSDQFYLLQQEPCSVVVLHESKQKHKRRKEASGASVRQILPFPTRTLLYSLYVFSEAEPLPKIEGSVVWGWNILNSCICIMFPVCSHLFSMMFSGFGGGP
jgi:hypothetical protein